jgi:hypothetical protein
MKKIKMLLRDLRITVDSLLAEKITRNSPEPSSQNTLVIRSFTNSKGVMLGEGINRTVYP